MSILLKSTVEWKYWLEYRTWINKPRMMRLLDRRHKVSLSDHRRYVASLKKNREHKFLGVFDKETKEFLGICALKNIDRRDKKAELYICLNDRGGKGSGHGVQAVEALLDYGFKKLKLNRIYLYTPSFNKRAIRCYQKVGFVKEGTFRDNVKIGSRYYDTVHMAYLKKMRKKKRKS